MRNISEQLQEYIDLAKKKNKNTKYVELSYFSEVVESVKVLEDSVIQVCSAGNMLARIISDVLEEVQKIPNLENMDILAQISMLNSTIAMYYENCSMLKNLVRDGIDGTEDEGT